MGKRFLGVLVVALCMTAGVAVAGETTDSGHTGFVPVATENVALARATAARLAEATGLDVRLWDERLSSFAADESLAGMLTRKKKRARQDAVAATAILQDFLSRGGPDCARRPDEVGP